MLTKKKRILLFADWYEPGFKGGGPIRSVVNFVYNMKTSHNIYVFTRDRDLGDCNPYPNVETDVWLQQEGVYIFYASPRSLNYTLLLRQMLEILPDYLYINSMYSLFFSIYPILLAKLHLKNSKVVLSPRGMLKSSALQFKRNKKRIFLSLFRLFKLHQNITFHATDNIEQKEVSNSFGNSAKSMVIPNFPVRQGVFQGGLLKVQGSVNIIFVGRIHPVKNLDFLLKVLLRVTAMVKLTIVCTIEDMPYWQICQDIIRQLPYNISVDVKTNVLHEDVQTLLKEHHIFALPTKGENFGHAIFEALSLGLPVLISDQTPWKNLESQSVGWDFPLEESSFSKAICYQSEMDNEEYQYWSKNAWTFVHAYSKQMNIKESYLNLFK